MTDQALKKSPAKNSWTVRVAIWSAKHRWLVFSLWFVCMFSLIGIGSVLGTKVREINSEADAVPNTESSKAWAVYYEDGATPPPQTVTVVISHPNLKVTDPAFKETVPAISNNLRTATYEGKPVFVQIIDVYSANMPYLASKDGTTTQVNAFITGNAEEQKKKLAPVRQTLKQIKTQYQDFEINSFNLSWLLDDLLEKVAKDMDGTLLITLPVTFIILLIAFGAFAAAFVPLVLGFSALMGAFGLLAIYSNVIEKVDFSTSQIIVLIGLAVAIDYSLFMLTRYRTERRRTGWAKDKASKLKAIEIASATAGRAVFFSGLTVMISLGGLFLMGESSFNAMAFGCIAVVALSVIASLTFLPATLAILGNGVNWGRIPYFGRDKEEGGGVWANIVGKVMRHPVVFTVITVAFLLVLTYPMLNLKLGMSGLESYSDNIEGIKAAKTLEAKWTEGATLKTYVFMTNFKDPAVKEALTKFQAENTQIKGLFPTNELLTSNGGNVSIISFYMTGSRNSEANKALIVKLRQDVLPKYFNGTSAKTYVSGEAAITVDIINLYAEKTPLVIAFVLALSFILLLVAFRSIVIPIKAILLNFLSLGASYGALVLAFQEGWLSTPLNFTSTGIIEAFLPLFMFTILFGLSMDYHLFILTRIKEAKDKGMDSNHAVAKGISVTSGTITSAAAIMVIVFAVFILLDLPSVRQMGFGLAVAVLIDATIIRSILLPSTMRLLGNWNWWLPGFLQWLPHVNIEGEAEEETVSAPSQAEKELTTV
jgi:RND superfamily putative drug exporter